MTAENLLTCSLTRKYLTKLGGMSIPYSVVAIGTPNEFFSHMKWRAVQPKSKVIH